MPEPCMTVAHSPFPWVFTNNLSSSLLFLETERYSQYAKKHRKCLPTINSYSDYSRGLPFLEWTWVKQRFGGRTTLPKVAELENCMVMFRLQTWCLSYYAAAELVVNQTGSPLSLWFWLVWRRWRKVCIKMLCDFGTRAVEAYGPLERLAIWARNSRMRFNWKNANEYIWRQTSRNTHG